MCALFFTIGFLCGVLFLIIWADDSSSKELDDEYEQNEKELEILRQNVRIDQEINRQLEQRNLTLMNHGPAVGLSMKLKPAAAARISASAASRSNARKIASLKKSSPTKK